MAKPSERNRGVSLNQVDSLPDQRFTADALRMVGGYHFTVTEPLRVADFVMPYFSLTRCCMVQHGPLTEP